jgi:hypothetical protein
MAKPENLRFSERKLALDGGERFMRSFGHTALGSKVIRATTGSRSPVYRQTDWFSQGISHDIRDTAIVPGDPRAPMLRRNWNQVAIFAATEAELVDLKDQAGPDPFKEAVAFVAEDVVRVGVKSTEGYLFENLTEEEVAIAMRLGRGPLEATMGLWLPDDRHFVSVENIRVVEAAVYQSSLPSDYPGVLHV